MPRVYPTAVCTSCGETKTIAARGLCRACYTRWARNGDTKYVRVFKDRTCTVEGCDRKQHGQGLCSKHLLRLRRTGTVEQGRVYTEKHLKFDANITQHDLYSIWREFSRSRNTRKVHPEWEADFKAFVADVTARPSKRHRIYPVDRSRILGPGNFEWREALVDKRPDETDTAYLSRIRLARKEIHGTFYSDTELRRKYGIGLNELRAMAEAQDYRCAICGEKETELRDGLPRHLAIDHDHVTGAVRGLLCQSCNTGLGKFRDSVSVMILAIVYLEKHGATK